MRSQTGYSTSSSISDAGVWVGSDIVAGTRALGLAADGSLYCWNFITSTKVKRNTLDDF